MSPPKAGYTTTVYRPDGLLEPNAKELRTHLERDEVRVLLTASVFGASALLDQVGQPQQGLFRLAMTSGPEGPRAYMPRRSEQPRQVMSLLQRCGSRLFVY